MNRKLKVPNHFLEDAITVVLLGAGGSGSEALEYLARIHTAMISMGHPHGLDVTVIDDSVVRESNIVRQRFWPTEVGQYKSITLVNRYNLMMGLKWKALPTRFPVSDDCPYGVHEPDIIISAVDLPSVRTKVYDTPVGDSIWLDFGNSDRTGQAVLGVLIKNEPKKLVGRYPNVLDHYPEVRDMEDDTTKSCSAAESIRKQDLLVNPAVVTLGMNMLWELIKHGETDKNMVVLSLESGQAATIKFDKIEVIQKAA